MADGLTIHERRLICTALASVPEITAAVLYGSRAIGTWKPGSDIDLAIEGNGLTHHHLARLAGRLDELPLPYRYDLTMRAVIANPALAAHINHHGVLFWRRGMECDEMVPESNQRDIT